MNREMIDNDRIRENLRKLRRDAKMSQSEVAEKLGIHPSTYKHLETEGGTEIIHRGIEKIPDLYGVSPEVFFCGSVGEADQVNEDMGKYGQGVTREKIVELGEELIRRGEALTALGRALLGKPEP